MADVGELLGQFQDADLGANDLLLLSPSRTGVVTVHEQLIMDMMTTDKQRSRREHSAELKAKILTECDVPGASVAKVAMAHGINANVVHRWRQLSHGQAPTGLAKTSEFISLPLAAPTEPAAVAPDVRVELRRGPVSITVTWPVSVAAELAAWTRELLR